MLKSEILVRWASVAPIGDETILAMRTILSPGERARADALRFDQDRRAYIAAHWLARTTLASLAGGSPSELHLAADETGKPSLEHPATQPRLNFNLSHTRQIVAVAVTLGRPIGVDVERVAADRTDGGMASLIFAPSEIAQFARHAEVERTRLECVVWTIKEASLKALGVGIDHKLTDMIVDPAAGRIVRLDYPGIDPSQFQIHVEPIGHDHSLAVAVLCIRPEDLRFRVERAEMPG